MCVCVCRYVLLNSPWIKLEDPEDERHKNYIYTRAYTQQAYCNITLTAHSLPVARATYLTAYVGMEDTPVIKRQYLATHRSYYAMLNNV